MFIHKEGKFYSRDEREAQGTMSAYPSSLNPSPTVESVGVALLWVYKNCKPQEFPNVRKSLNKFR